MNKAKKPKIIVVFDTNIFRGQWWLGNDVHWAEYKKCAELLEIETYLPEPVFLEITDRATSLYAKSIQEIEKNVNRINEQCINLNKNFLIGPHKNLKAVIQACKRLDSEWPARDQAPDLIRDALIVLLGVYKTVHTNVMHTKLLGRLFARKKPFKDKDNDKGYRDSLIWFCVLELATKHQLKTVVFITDNSKDFSKSDDETVLDQAFLDDLYDANIDTKRIVYLRSLQDFNRGYFEPKLTAAKDWLDKFEEDNEESFEEFFSSDVTLIQEALLENIEEIIDFSDFHGYDYSDFDFPYFGDVENLVIIAVKQFDENLVLIELSFSVEFTLNFGSENFPAYTLEENSVFGIAMRLNDHYVEVETAGTFEVQMRILFNSADREIEKISLDQVTVA